MKKFDFSNVQKECSRPDLSVLQDIYPLPNTHYSPATVTDSTSEPKDDVLFQGLSFMLAHFKATQSSILFTAQNSNSDWFFNEKVSLSIAKLCCHFVTLSIKDAVTF